MMLTFHRVRTMVLAVAVLAAFGGAPSAARDQDEARKALQAGEIRPLEEILNTVRGKLPGEIVRVKLEREMGGWKYELRVLDDRGRLLEIYVDARSGRIERTKEK